MTVTPALCRCSAARQGRPPDGARSPHLGERIMRRKRLERRVLDEADGVDRSSSTSPRSRPVPRRSTRSARRALRSGNALRRRNGRTPRPVRRASPPLAYTAAVGTEQVDHHERPRRDQREGGGGGWVRDNTVDDLHAKNCTVVHQRADHIERPTRGPPWSRQLLDAADVSSTAQASAASRWPAAAVEAWRQPPARLIDYFGDLDTLIES